MSARRSLARKALFSVLAVLIAFALAFPFLWMFFASFKSSVEIFTPLPLLPQTWSLEYFRALFSGEWLAYPRLFANSLWIALIQTALAVAISIGAGFVLGRYQSRTIRWTMAIAVVVILVPRPILVVPLFEWMAQLRLLDTSWAIVLPGIVSGLGVIYFALAFRRVPRELVDTARVEGASELRVFWELLPIVRSATISYALIHFLLAWHAHLLPVVLLFSPEKMPVTVKLASMLSPESGVPYALLMAGSLFTIVPTAVFFLLVRRHFRSSLSELWS